MEEREGSEGFKVSIIACNFALPSYWIDNLKELKYGMCTKYELVNWDKVSCPLPNDLLILIME